MNSGIYCIRNTLNGMVYVGQSIRVSDRWGQHLRLLRMKAHFNDYLQHSFSKHGEKSFAYSVLEMVDPVNLDEREIHWIREFNSCDQTSGFNIFEGGLGRSFVPMSVRLKISKALTGMKRSPESIMKSAIGNTGKKRSDQARKNMSGRRPGPDERRMLSISQMGRIITQETRAKISATLLNQRESLRARMLGKSPSEETRRKIALSLTGRKQSQETIKKRALACTGRITSPETKAKISAFHKGNKWGLGTKRSPESRALMSEKAKIREANKRAKCLTNTNS